MAVGVQNSEVAPFDSAVGVQNSAVAPFNSAVGVQNSEVAPFDSAVGVQNSKLLLNKVISEKENTCVETNGGGIFIPVNRLN
ncbi:MAG: hypothetical protein V7K50_05870 [Nostoc sp.]|uniref:hypothetical protein n=1 Tax=Nostoc sp. TaxID=1180 RepID=UPI002FFCF960